MATLQPNHKRFIVRALARYNSPTRVAQLVKAEFDFEPSRQQVRHYNPDQNDELAAEWVELFRAERKEFLADEPRAGVGHENYLLEVLQGVLDRELDKAKPAPSLVMDLIRLAAQIKGGVFRRQEKTEPPPTLPPSILAAIAKVYGTQDTQVAPVAAGDGGKPAGSGQ